jgi:hypothetical protein
MFQAIKKLSLLFFLIIGCPEVMGQENVFKKIDSEKPDGYYTEAFYPNPYGFSTSIKVYVPDSSFIETKILNDKGEGVRDIYKGDIDGGVYQITWDLNDNTGEQVTQSGDYYLLIELSSDHGEYKTRQIKFSSKIKMSIYL